MRAAREWVVGWWGELAPSARRVMIVGGSVFAIWLVLSLLITAAVGNPKGSRAGKRFERRLASEELFVERRDLAGPRGLALYLKHGGRLLKVEDHASLGLWWGARLSAVGLVLLLATLPLWGPLSAGPRASDATETGLPKFGTGSVVALSLVLVAAAFLRAQRLEGPLLRDEQDTLKRNVWGILTENETGDLTYQRAGWQEAFFENGGANNPILFSLAARLSLGVWRAVSGAPEDRFSLAALRMPSLVAGVLSVGALALLGWRLGYPLAGVCAAFLLAIHPWHIRYSVEGRGYSLAILFALLGWAMLAAALRSGKWRDWIGFAAAQMLLIYSYTGAIYVAGVQSLLTICFLLACRRFVQLLRFLVPVAASALLYIQLVMPCAPQILNYLAKETTFGVMNAGWAAETLGAFVGGVNLGLYQGEPPPEFSPVWDLRSLPSQHPLLAALIVLAVVSFLVGAVRLWRAGAVPRLIGAAMVASPLVAYTHNKITGHYLYPWYLIYALPALLLLMALAATWPGGVETSLESAPARVIGSILPAAALAALLAISVPRSWYRPAAKAAGPHELWRGNKRIVIYPEGFVIQCKGGKEG